MSRIPVESRLRVNGMELVVWEWPGAGPPVLLCHATSFHARCWDQVISRLPGRHCYAFDARGHGRSSKPAPPYSWRSIGEDIAALAVSLGLTGAVGVGHSMGGHAVTLGAALQPSAFSILLLIDPVIRARAAYIGPWDRARFAPKRRNRWASPQEMYERFENRAPFDAWDRAVLRDYCEYGLLPDGDGFVLACPPEIETSVYENGPAVEANIYAEIAAISIPVRVVRSGKFSGPANVMGSSPTSPNLAASFTHGTDLCLEEHSHFIPMEAPELTAKLIADALALL
jgi:lipase